MMCGPLRSKTEIIYKKSNYINYEEDLSLEWIDFDEAKENTGKINFYFYLILNDNFILCMMYGFEKDVLWIQINKLNACALNNVFFFTAMKKKV